MTDRRRARIAAAEYYCRFQFELRKSLPARCSLTFLLDSVLLALQFRSAARHPGTLRLLPEWIEDLHNWVVRFTLKEAHGLENGRNSENKAVMVENGFLSVYSKDSQYSHVSARDLFLAKMERSLKQQRGEEVSITLCGHSLGAALSLLCAYDLGHMVSIRSPQVVVTVFTFGCPRVGNKLFARNLQELNVRVLRDVNVNDVVPRVPGVMMNECRVGNFLRATQGVLFADWVQPWITVCLPSSSPPGTL